MVYREILDFQELQVPQELWALLVLQDPKVRQVPLAFQAIRVIQASQGLLVQQD